MKKSKILGIDIDNITMDEAVSVCKKAISENKKFFVVTPNSEIIAMANENKTFYDIVESADLKIPDGIGVVIASKIVKEPIKERVTGIDLMENLLKYCNEEGKSIFLLGGKEGVAEKAAKNIKKRYNKIDIKGTHHGYYKGIHSGHKGNEEELKVISKINSLKPDILFVGFGAPKQEYFISTYKKDIDAKLFIGIGGSFDVYSGNVKRAPKIYQNLGVEWLYRTVKEPKRIGRTLKIPVFLVNVLKNKSNGNF